MRLVCSIYPVLTQQLYGMFCIIFKLLGKHLLRSFSKSAEMFSALNLRADQMAKSLLKSN